MNKTCGNCGTTDVMSAEHIKSCANKDLVKKGIQAMKDAYIEALATKTTKQNKRSE